MKNFNEYLIAIHSFFSEAGSKEIVNLIVIIGITWIFAWLAITSKSPIHSILSLILLFISSAVVFITFLKLQFIGTLLIVIYVGAVSILFLFVVMIIPTRSLLDSTTHLSEGVSSIKNNLLRFVVVLFLLVILISVFKTNALLFNELTEISVNSWDIDLVDHYTNFNWDNSIAFFDVYVVGNAIYKEHIFSLVAAVMLLFIALIAAVVICEDRI